ncbi:hypothetical protein MN0502_11810 [Arthrobacter sp. MN05-02]|nr:hypothetical protein MN0502_11810 [Arthrobacter sp. MN05-02]
MEFLVSDAAPDEFFFMEMNTRLQVEHPVTELVTGIDLVEWQIRIAAGEELPLTQDDVVLTGHAVEARVYAENPEAGFLPSTGRILELAEPSGEGIRVDSSLLPGGTVSSSYDPMLAKVLAWGADRGEALDRLDAALAATVVLGVDTNVEYLRLLVGDDDVRAARLDTTMIERKLPELAFRHVAPRGPRARRRPAPRGRTGSGRRIALAPRRRLPARDSPTTRRDPGGGRRHRDGPAPAHARRMDRNGRQHRRLG